MWNNYQPYRRKIRFFPHIVPIGFPLIFPVGILLVLGLLHELFPLIGLLILVALGFFIVRALTQGNPGSMWNSMRSMGSQWSQGFNGQNQQPPSYQPPPSAGQEQPYGQGYQPGSNPSYQPPTQPQQEQSPYYQPGTNPYYNPAPRAEEAEQPPLQQH
jgi:hypothetical protein